MALIDIIQKKPLKQVYGFDAYNQSKALYQQIMIQNVDRNQLWNVQIAKCSICILGMTRIKHVAIEFAQSQTTEDSHRTQNLRRRHTHEGSFFVVCVFAVCFFCGVYSHWPFVCLFCFFLARCVAISHEIWK